MWSLQYLFGLLIVSSGVNGDSTDPWWYLQIGRNVHQDAKAAGIIEQHMDKVWEKVKDFGNWNFYEGISTVCVERDEETGYCVVRNVTQKGYEISGYELGADFYQERQNIEKRKDDLLEKVIHYERVSTPQMPAKSFQSKIKFKVTVDPSHPTNTFVEQSAKFRLASRNIVPLAKELAEFGFLQMINSLRSSFEGDTRFAGHVEINLRHNVICDVFDDVASGLGLNTRQRIHINRNKTIVGGKLQVISGDLIFEEDIIYGVTTNIRAGFDQINNGWVTINILSNDENNGGGRKIICSTQAQVYIEPTSISFGDSDSCSGVLVTGRAILPSVAAMGIFRLQTKTLILGEALELANAGGQELLGYSLTAANQIGASEVAYNRIKFNALEWDLTFGNFTSIPLYVDQLSYEFYGLATPHLMDLVKGHIDWFAGNLQPTVLAYKAMTQKDPWQNFLLPGISQRYDEALLLLKLWGNDDEFCRQFMQGANPLEITKVVDNSIIPQEFNSIYTYDSNDDLYYVEYSILHTIMDVIPEDNILYPDTFVLFRSADKSLSPTSLLEVIGIQVEKNGKIYHKNDSKRWRYLYSKMIVQNMAMQTQEFLWHLGVGHFLSEGFISSVHNAFSYCDGSDCSENVGNNPIYRLLKPHFRYTLGMNSLARIILDGRSTKVADLVFAAGHKGVIKLINHWYSNYSFSEFDIEKQILNRGITQNDLPKYYYRDDSIELLGILRKYCKSVVYDTYKNDKELQNDRQLQLFAELSAQNVNGFPNQFNTRDELYLALANVISTPIILHTATNYAQAPYNFFPVNRPFRLTKRMSDFDGHGDFTPNFINSALPEYFEYFIGCMFMHVLTLPPDNSLLDTSQDDSIFSNLNNHKLEKNLKESQNKFYKNLVKFQEKINQRTNKAKKENRLAYPYFDPAVACSSTNI